MQQGQLQGSVVPVIIVNALLESLVIMVLQGLQIITVNNIWCIILF